MTLVVENGTGVANANTYASDADFVAYAAARGVTIPTTGGARELLLIKAMDVLESYDARFVGSRVARDQALAWPRAGVVVNGWDYASNDLPVQLKQAQLLLALEVQDGVDHNNPPAPALPVVSQSVEGAVSVQYAAPSQGVAARRTYASAGVIRTLLKSAGGGVLR